MSGMFKDKRSPEARRFRMILIYRYRIARLHKSWASNTEQTRTGRAQAILKTADDIINQTPLLTSFDKLSLLGLLYGKTKSRAMLGETIAAHAQTQGRVLMFQFIAEEILNPTRPQEFLSTAHDRFVQLNQNFVSPLARKLLLDCYTHKIEELNDQYPKGAIYLASTLNYGNNAAQHPFAKLAQDLLERAAKRYSSEDEAFTFIDIASAALQGTRDGKSQIMLIKLSLAASELFVSLLTSNHRATWNDVHTKLVNTSESLKKLIPLAKETFGPRHRIWGKLSMRLPKQYRFD